MFWIILRCQSNLEGRSLGGKREVVGQQCWSNKSSRGRSGDETTRVTLVGTKDRLTALNLSDYCPALYSENCSNMRAF
jgi:hypothetical protein